MTIDPASERLVAEMESSLRPQVTSFEKSPVENGRKIRELLNSNRIAFPLAAARVFRDDPDARGCRYLITTLWTHNLLISLLSDASVPQPLRASMAQTAVKLDPQFHVRLVAFLQKRETDRDAAAGEAATNLLDILSCTMDPVAMGPLLQKILVHPNARLRSRAARLTGRAHSGIAAVEKLALDPDPRVRANAMEALWSNPDPRVESVFLKALDDSNNRVVGNAILGLYLAGSTETATASVLGLASHPNPVFRATGAWVMGRTGDPNFLPYLGKLLGESSGELRKVVFQSLQASLRGANARAEVPKPRFD